MKKLSDAIRVSVTYDVMPYSIEISIEHQKQRIIVSVMECSTTIFVLPDVNVISMVRFRPKTSRPLVYQALEL